MIKSTLKIARYCPLVIEGFSNFLGLFQVIMANPGCGFESTNCRKPIAKEFAAAEANRTELRVRFLEQIRRLRQLEHLIQQLVFAAEIFEVAEHNAEVYPNQELAVQIQEVRGTVVRILQGLHPEMTLMINDMWCQYGPPTRESPTSPEPPEPETR